MPHPFCFSDHYETRTRTTTDQDGMEQTETYEETVTTHTAHTIYDLPGWSDESTEPSPTSHDITKVRYTRHFRYAHLVTLHE